MRLSRRALVAVTELLAVIMLAWLAWWCWHRGVIVTTHNGVALHRIEGRWWTAATGAATLAGLLALDALRRGVLARSGKLPGGEKSPAAFRGDYA